MQEVIPLDCFLFTEIVEFEREGNIIYVKDLPKKEKWRLIIFIDGVFLDLITGDEILPLPAESDGTLIDTLYANTRYVNILQKPTREITDFEKTRAKEVYDAYLERKRNIEKKKVIPFEQKRLI